jgi:acid phosphatase
LPSSRFDRHVFDFAQWPRDRSSGAIADYVFITPNLDDDMHDGTIAQGDAWLAAEVPAIMATGAYQGGGVLFVLWDEGINATDDPPFIVVSPNVTPGTVSQADYDTSSFLLTVEKILGVDALPCSPDPAAVRPMTDLFKVPL